VAEKAHGRLFHRPLPEPAALGSNIESGLIRAVNVDHDIENILIEPQPGGIGNPMKAVDDVAVAAVQPLTRCEE
jgi:hypothetical protein